MPIGSLERNKSLPRIGKIRLGIKKEGRNSKYPGTVPHFVLKDAPGVEDIYGPNPTAIDVIFPHRDRNIVLPTWFRLYGGGYRNEQGEMEGGELWCRGDGIAEDGGPGTAQHFQARDPKTRAIPLRPCHERDCPDFYDKKGNQQCKAGMKVIAMLPDVSMDGVFHIDTTSWESMHNFISVFDWALSRPEYFDIFTTMPFTLYREETKKKITAQDGAKKTSVQYIMKLKVNSERYMKMKADGFFNKKMSPLQLNSFEADMIDQLPMDDNYLLPGEEESPLVQDVKSDAVMVARAKSLLADPQVGEAFEHLEAASGEKLTEKKRIIKLRAYDQVPDQELKDTVINNIKAVIVNKYQKPQTPPKGADGII